MSYRTNSPRSWLAIASFSISLFTLCTLPLPMVPSSVLGFLSILLGGFAIWRIHRNGGTNRDRLLAMGGIGIGFIPIISFCITTILILREIPQWVAFLSEKLTRWVTYISLEFPRIWILLSNLFR